MIHLLAYFIYRLALAVSRGVRIETVFRAGEMLGGCGYWLLRRRRRLTHENLTRAFRDRSPAEIRQLARDHFRLLGANLLSCVKLETMSGEAIRARVTMELSVAVPPPEERRGWVAMISHLGNWELFSHLAEFFPEFRFGAVYHPLANAFINSHIAGLRARAGITLFDRRCGYLKCVKFLRDGGGLGVLIDQFAGVAGVWTPLFGRLTSTSQLAATLAMRADAEVVPIGIYTVGCARWKVVTGRPFRAGAEESAELTARMNRELEMLIRRAPADWLWAHDRWKTPRPRFLLARDWRRCASGGEKLEPFRIVIRAPNERVEAEASVPAIAAIRRGRPDAWVAVAASEDLRDVFGEVDAFIVIERQGSVWAAARAIRAAGEFDAGIILPKSLRAALELSLAGVPCRAGHPARFWLNDWKMEPGESPPPDRGADRYLRIAEVLGAVVKM